jgi:pilus assembly protein CpaF
LSTIHANSAVQALQRFTSCVLQSGVELPYRAIKSHIADSIQILVHIERSKGLRVVSDVLSVEGYILDSDKYQLRPLYQAGERQG